ncbi:MAG: DUF1566 domain-containing protein [Planctomycetes bacterium]|nr:DUF1566 domain-containing protein [Planctomycetota bacterium]
MWQKDTADVPGDGTVGGEDSVLWCDALRYCEGLTFAGYDDWRLPNIRELLSIVDYGRWDPAIDPVFRALPAWHWSSESGAFAPDFAWDVSFLNGADNGGDDCTEGLRRPPGGVTQVLQASSRRPPRRREDLRPAFPVW